MRLTDGTRTARRTLVIDLLALGAFIVAGMRSHGAASAFAVFARNAVPLGASWIVVAAVAGAYRPVRITRLIATWGVAVPAGVLVRSVFTGSPAGEDLLVFVGVALAFTSLFLGIGRVAVAALSARASRVP